MHVSRIRLVMLAAGMLAASPAFAYNLTVVSRAASFGGAGSVTDLDAVDSDGAAVTTWQAIAAPAVDCAVGSTANCSAVPADGTTPVVLSAAPALGSAFAGWQGCNSTATTFDIGGGGTLGPATLTGNFCLVSSASAAKTVTAWFKPAAYSLVVKPTTGSVAVTIGAAAPVDCAGQASCTYAVAVGASVTLNATPLAASTQFASFAGCTGNPCTFAMTGARSVTANFKASGYLVSVTTSGLGEVSGTGINCPTAGSCSTAVTAGGSLTLTASPAPSTWFGCTTFSGATCNVTNVQSNRAVSAYFGATGACKACHNVPPASHQPALTASSDCAGCHGAGFSSNTTATGHNDGKATLASSVRTTAVAKPDEALSIQITGKVVSATQVTSVSFKVLDKAGQPVAGVYPTIHLGKLNDDGTYKSYYTRSATGANYTSSITKTSTAPAITEPVNQDTSAWAGTVTGGVPANFAYDSATGVYTFTFPSGTASGVTGSSTVADADKSKLHTIAMYATRALSGYNFRATASIDFAPDGTEVVQRQVVTDAACNTCHGELQLHGQRRGVKSCLVCHNPTTIDPESGNNVDMATLIHKIHNGHLLTQDPYRIVGYQQTDYVYNHVLMAPSHSGYFEGGGLYAAAHDPGLSRECGICHQGSQASFAFTKPSRRACGSCHDDVNWNLAHNGALRTDDSSCTTCHPEAEVKKYHSRFYEPATGVNFRDSAQVNPPIPEAGHDFTVKLVSVANIVEGDPAVTKTVYVIEPKLDGAVFNVMTPPTGWRLSTCAFTAAGPTSDYVVPATGGNTSSCSNGAWTALANGRYQLKMAANALTGADGYYRVGFEIMASRVFGNTTDYVRKPFSADPNFLLVKKTGTSLSVVTDPVEKAIRDRRAVVSFEKCNACHVDLGFHSNRGRKGPDYCAECHNPKLDNGGRARYQVAEARDGSTFGLTGADATKKVYLPESVSMNVFIHRIHMGKALPSVSGFELFPASGTRTAATRSPWVQTQGVIKYGATRSNYVGTALNSPPEIADFSSFLMPNVMNRCDQCHISSATWALNERTGQAPVERTIRECTPGDSTVAGTWATGTGNTPADWCFVNASGAPKNAKIVTPPMKAACTSCHDSAATNTHVDAYTQNPMSATAVEKCAGCHGAGTVLDSVKVHRPVP